MQSKELHREGDLRIFAVVFEKGEGFISGLKQFAQENSLNGAHFTAIGAFQTITLEYFQRQKMEYKKIPVNEQVEVLSLIGNIAQKGSELKVHAHVVLGKSDGTAIGGHILEASVWPTLEVVVEETPEYLRRTVDDQTGLALINVEA